MTIARLSILSSILLLVLLSGCGGGGWGAGGWSMPPLPVETDVAKIRPVADQFTTVGTLDADRSVTIVAEIGGTIVSIPFEEGGSVSQGSLIAQLDDRELRAEYDRSVAIREQSTINFNRMKSVVDQGAGAQQDLDDVSAALKVAEANESSAKARLDKTRITAPFDGSIGARKVSRGAFVQPGQPITDLANIHDLRVTFSVPERYLAELKKGSEVIVTTTAFPGEELKGKIDVIEPMVDAATRSTQVVARVKNPDAKFRPGMSANVTAVLTMHGDALTVSNEAVFVDQNQSFVYVINPDSTVKRAPLKLGSRMTDVVEVTSGLRAGELVVRTGHQKIFEGGKVIPLPAQGAPVTKDTTASAAGAQK